MSKETNSTERSRKDKFSFKKALSNVPAAVWVIEAAILGTAAGGAIEDYLNYTTSHKPSSIVSNRESDLVEDINFAGGRINVKFGIPTGYTLFDGSPGVFNPQEVISLKEKAISSKEPQILAIFPFYGLSFVFGDHYNPKHPEQHQELQNLPEDVLSDSELLGKGVEIIQSDKTHLHIRKRAFEEDGPLADFNSTHRKLTIVLVDGPAV